MVARNTVRQYFHDKHSYGPPGTNAPQITKVSQDRSERPPADDIDAYRVVSCIGRGIIAGIGLWLAGCAFGLGFRYAMGL